MTGSIFIVTFARDLPFYRLCCRSLVKHAVNWSSVVVVVPQRDYEAFAQATPMRTTSGTPFIVRYHYESEEKGHQWMNATKCCADLYCHDAELIAHIDADSVLTHATSPGSYLIDGQIAMATCPYEEAGDAKTWKPLVDRALGINARLETMQSPILAFWRDTYWKMREHIEELHHEPFIDHALTHHVAEFDTLGAFALLRHPAIYAPMDRLSREWAAVPKFVMQGWSHYRDNPDALRTELARLEAAIG